MHTHTRPARRLRALSATVAAVLGLTAAVAATVPAVAAQSVSAPGSSTAVSGGTLDWGFEQLFRNDVPASGQSATGGASKNRDGTFRFTATGGSYDPAGGTLSVEGSGAAVFDHRAHSFVITLSDPAIELTPTTGTLTAGVRVRVVDPVTGATTSDPGTKRIAIATIDVTKGTRSVTAGTSSWTALPTTLTAAGAAAFAADVSGGGEPTQFSPAGTALDPLSVAVTVDGTGGSGGPPGGGTVVGVDGAITGAENASGASTTVRSATELTTATGGTRLTVTGSGFTKHTNGSGLYVLFGYVTEHPSSGGAAGAGYDYLPGAGGAAQDGQGFVAWPDNTGTGAAATATLSATKDAGFTQAGITVRSSFTGQSTKEVDCLSGAVQCGVLTIGAHGLADAALETFTPVYFAGQTVPGALPTGPTTGGDTGGGSGGGTVILPPVVQLPPAATAPTITTTSDTAPAAAPRNTAAEPRAAEAGAALPRAAQPGNGAKAPSAAEPPTAPAADSDELASAIAAGDITTVAAADAGIPDEVTAGGRLELRLPWTGDDEGGSVWTYSEPVQGDDFTVEDGTATASVDTTGLKAGGHHVVLVGDQGTVVAVPFTVVDGVAAAVQSTDGSLAAPTTPDGGAGGGMTTETLLLVVIGFLGGLVVLAIGLVVLLLTGVLQVRTRRKPAVASAATAV